jgi:hypothetical protein
VRNKKQGKGCLEKAFPRPHNVWELSALGMPKETTDFTFIKKLKHYKRSPLHAANQPKPDCTCRVVDYIHYKPESNGAIHTHD